MPISGKGRADANPTRPYDDWFAAAFPIEFRGSYNRPGAVWQGCAAPRGADSANQVSNDKSLAPRPLRPAAMPCQGWRVIGRCSQSPNLHRGLAQKRARGGPQGGRIGNAVLNLSTRSREGLEQRTSSLPVAGWPYHGRRKGGEL